MVLSILASYKMILPFSYTIELSLALYSMTFSTKMKETGE